MKKNYILILFISLLFLILSCEGTAVVSAASFSQDYLSGIYSDVIITYSIINIGSTTIDNWVFNFELLLVNGTILTTTIIGPDLYEDEEFHSTIIVYTGGIEALNLDYDLDY